MKKVRYHDIQRNGIREIVIIVRCETRNDMISSAREREIDLDHIGKRGPHQVYILGGPEKRPKISDQRVRGQHGWIQYNTFGKIHDGVFRSKGLGKCIYGFVSLLLFGLYLQTWSYVICIP